MWCLPIDDSDTFDRADKAAAYDYRMAIEHLDRETISEYWIECWSDMSEAMRVEIKNVMPCFFSIDRLSKDQYYAIEGIFCAYDFYDRYINVLVGLAYNTGLDEKDTDVYTDYQDQRT